LLAAAIIATGWLARERWAERVARVAAIDPVAEAMADESEPDGAELPMVAAMTAPGAITRDGEGRVLRVEGRSPVEVLLAFCDARADTVPCDPLEVRTLLPDHAALRAGLFQDSFEGIEPRGIRIFRDPQSRRWVAGDGRHALDGVPATELPLGPPVAAIDRRSRKPVAR
jgi:hypothetical protein